ncbi:MAG: PAS domain-containing sensor histidine kinase [Acidobacteria bacterium]|nr:MAG: PAS domain-containing sensor histidine kinase [Acidobacteriota bacterium]
MAVFHSPLFRKFLISTFVLIAATLLILDSFLTAYIGQRETQSVQHRLTVEARILSGGAPTIAPAKLEEWAKQAAARAQARVTVVDPKGAVLADSEHDPETMENHANRPEIRQAYAGQVGVSIRHSATLDRDFCYVAISFPYQGSGTFILRLAVPLEELDTAVAAVRWWMFEASLIALALAMMIAYFFSVRFTLRIRRLQSFAENLVATRASQDLAPDADDELGEFARSLNRMAAQLRSSLDRLSLESARREAILSAMVEGVLAVDHEMRITFCNDSFARVIGAPATIAERTPLLEVVRDAGLRDMFRQVLASGKPLKQRLEVPAADGRSFEVQAAPLSVPSSVSSRWGAIAVLHDITDLERLERVRKDFVANVSHELRTPLTAIRGYAETLLEGALEDPANNRKFLEIIKAQAARLNNIASDLLVLSELESGKPDTAEPEALRVRSVLESALRTVESAARVAGVRLDCVNVEDVCVVGSKIRLEQALVNLLDNAIKFNRPSGEVRIEARRVQKGLVNITVTDTGIGIASEDLPRIFERFYRVDKAHSRAVGGTGLGLSIVKHVVERMNGKITVASELGKGTVFSLKVPACHAN